MIFIFGLTLSGCHMFAFESFFIMSYFISFSTFKLLLSVFFEVNFFLSLSPFWLSSENRWRCSVKKAVFKNFARFTGNHRCWSFLLITLQAVRLVTLLTKDSKYCCFPVNITRFLRSAFFDKTPPVAAQDSLNGTLLTHIR